uniref:protein-tyrosine-phosphatase n=1 Tax=Hippocampus comes TaxID=109280 RepID=A0A3Q2Z3B1_HIPCM
MLWEYDIKVIVMACREFEMGKKKCERYWPRYCGNNFKKINLLYWIFMLIKTKIQHRTLKQLHYVNWPDHGVPDSIPSILDLLEEMRTYQSHDDIPLCIHCRSAFSFYSNNIFK